MHLASFPPSLILILLIFEPFVAIRDQEITRPPYAPDSAEMQPPLRARRAASCCPFYSSYSAYSIKCGTIPCGNCCYRTPPPAFTTPFKIPPLPFTVPPSLPPSPTAVNGCSVCG